MSEQQDSRRDFVRRAVYVAPAIVSLAATPSFAKAGSIKQIRPVTPPKPPKVPLPPRKLP